MKLNHIQENRLESIRAVNIGTIIQPKYILSASLHQISCQMSETIFSPKFPNSCAKIHPREYPTNTTTTIRMVLHP